MCEEAIEVPARSFSSAAAPPLASPRGRDRPRRVDPSSSQSHPLLVFTARPHGDPRSARPNLEEEARATEDKPAIRSAPMQLEDDPRNVAHRTERSAAASTKTYFTIGSHSGSRARSDRLRRLARAPPAGARTRSTSRRAPPPDRGALSGVVSWARRRDPIARSTVKPPGAPATALAEEELTTHVSKHQRYGGEEHADGQTRLFRGPPRARALASRPSRGLARRAHSERRMEEDPSSSASSMTIARVSVVTSSGISTRPRRRSSTAYRRHSKNAACHALIGSPRLPKLGRAPAALPDRGLTHAKAERSSGPSRSDTQTLGNTNARAAASCVAWRVRKARHLSFEDKNRRPTLCANVA